MRVQRSKFRIPGRYVIAAVVITTHFQKKSLKSINYNTSISHSKITPLYTVCILHILLVHLYIWHLYIYIYILYFIDNAHIHLKLHHYCLEPHATIRSSVSHLIEIRKNKSFRTIHIKNNYQFEFKKPNIYCQVSTENIRNEMSCDWPSLMNYVYVIQVFTVNDLP